MGIIRKTKGDVVAPKRVRRTQAESTANAAPSTVTAAPAAAHDPAAELSHQEIERRAYELYVASGCTPGNEVQHWLAAEAELRAGAHP